MAPPSYARATASSVNKATPTSSPSKPPDARPQITSRGLPSKAAAPMSPSKYTNSPSKPCDAKRPSSSTTSPSKPCSTNLRPPSTPKKELKRPSPLTPQHRQSISYKADLFPIIPADPSKPCPLATLPSELRTSIYLHLLSPSFGIPQPRFILRPRTGTVHYIFPSLLHISRAIRIEAAWVYYTFTPFTFTIRNFDFSIVLSWLETLPLRHRGLLARNRDLSLKIIPGMRPGYSYPPPGYLLDGWLKTHWKNCSAFGNLYTIKSNEHRVHFILFCRLVGWFRWNDRPLWRETKWRYGFECVKRYNTSFQEWMSGETLVAVEFLRGQVGVVAMGCVAKAWMRDRGDGQGRGREEARAFLSALDEVFVGREMREGVLEEWAGEMKRIRKAVEGW